MNFPQIAVSSICFSIEAILILDNRRSSFTDDNFNKTLRLSIRGHFSEKQSLHASLISFCNFVPRRSSKDKEKEDGDGDEIAWRNSVSPAYSADGILPVSRKEKEGAWENSERPTGTGPN